MWYKIVEDVIPEHCWRRRVIVVSFSSININVIPSIGHIVNVSEVDRTRIVTPSLTQTQEVEAWRARKGALHAPPRDFDPSRYASFSVREVVEEPVASEYINDYVERSRLSRRLGFWSSYHLSIFISAF